MSGRIMIRLGVRSGDRLVTKFALAAKIIMDSSAKFTKFGIVDLRNLRHLRSERLRLINQERETSAREVWHRLAGNERSVEPIYLGLPYWNRGLSSRAKLSSLCTRSS
jgi:hypothetical protein